jgi:peptide/nickel transport system permease protein
MVGSPSSDELTTSSPHFVRRLLRRRLAIACLAFLAAIAVIGIVAPIVLPGVAHERAGDLLAVRQGPSSAHLLGTDTLGRDVLQRLLVGTQPSLIGVAEALAVVLALGIPLGLIAGYFGGWADRIVNSASDLALSLPAIIVILVVLSIFPQNMTAGMVTLGVLSAPGLMRIVRSVVLPVKEELYIAAALVSGLSRMYIVFRHVLPRIAGAVIVQGSLLAAAALLAQSGLAFLGLLVPAPSPSWGGMLADGATAIVLQPWLIWPPGVVIAAAVLALGLLGDMARDASAETWAAPVLRRPSRARQIATAPPAIGATGSLLRVTDLTVSFVATGGQVTRVVEDVSFDVQRGETVGVVGESGSGKTVTALAVLGLLPGTGRIESGSIAFGGRDLASLTEPELREIRGREIGLVSQDSMVSFNPAYRVGWQLAEVVRRHHRVGARAARAKVIELLRQVHLPDPEVVARRYPHELSGGMAQRIAVARALAGEPRLLIADEPTTALDVTLQAEILDLLRELQRARGMAILLITHDWGVVADLCERAVVMYAGQVVERARILPMFREPLHPYTEALLAANPHAAPEVRRLPSIPGAVPQPGRWPSGCHFHPRCAYASEGCRNGLIELQNPADERETRCINHDHLVAAR